MLLGDLLAGIRCRWARGEAEDVSVTGVTHDSRRAGPGVVFVAVRGLRADGLEFAPEAVARGAAAIVVGPGRAGSPRLAGAARVIEAEDERAALALMARDLYGRLDETLPVVGVTGTNGKTTTCRIAAAILRAAGIKAGVIGTVAHWLGDVEIVAERTTPEAPEIHRYLSCMRRAGCSACVMEVSSHALDLRRVHGVRFAVGVFTNLTRDHLDYHRDMERYFEAKALLFASLGPEATACINLDDAYGRRLTSSLRDRGGRPPAKLVTYGTAPGASLRMVRIGASTAGCRVALETSDGGVDLASPLLGRPNAYNVTAAAAAARAMGIGWDAIARGVAAVRHVPGRMEPVEAPARGRVQPFRVLVDYAHTDDALRRLLETVREVTAGRILLVFGCGGDRDRTKRPLMGEHAARLADLVFVTSDNPRSEPPGAIIEQILAGAARVEAGGGRRAARLEAVPDRRAAIETALRAARPGDVVVVAGKGHETHQIAGDRVTPFDDRVVARELLEAVLGGEGSGGAS